MSFSPAPKVPGAFPRSATPSPQKQPAPKLDDDDMPPVPSLPMPGDFHVDQQFVAIPASQHMDPEKTAVPAYGHKDRTSSGSVQQQLAIPAEEQMDQHSMAVPAEKHTDHCAAAIPALRHMDQKTSFGCGSGLDPVERVDSPTGEPQMPVEDSFDEPDQSLTALPLAPSSDCDKHLPRPSSFKRLFRLSKEESGAHKESSRASVDSTTALTNADHTSKPRRVLSSVGGGLRALKLRNRSAVVVERSSSGGSSTNLLVKESSWHSFEAIKKKCAPSAESLAVAPGQFDKPDWLEFPLPPGAQVEDSEQMRIRAALVEQEEEAESIRVAVEETDPPDVDPIDWTSHGIMRARRKSQRAVDKGKSAGNSSPDSITTVLRHRRRKPYKEPVRRSSSTETVVRHPIPSTTTTTTEEKQTPPTASTAATATPKTDDLVNGEGSHQARKRSVSAQTLPKYSLFPSLKDPRERPQPVRLDTVRRASIPARLPLSPALLGQPIHASGPSARASPAAASPSPATPFSSRRFSTNADSRTARRQSRNFSRPFAIAGHEAASRPGGSQDLWVEDGSIGLAISEGPSPVKPLQDQQSATSIHDGAMVSFADTPDWPLGPAPADKPLLELAEEDE